LIEILKKSDFNDVSTFFIDGTGGIEFAGDVKVVLSTENGDSPLTVIHGGNRFKIDSFSVVDGTFFLSVLPEENMILADGIPSVHSLLRNLTGESLDDCWEGEFWDCVPVEICIGEYEDENDELLGIKKIYFDEKKNEVVVLAFDLD